MFPPGAFPALSRRFLGAAARPSGSYQPSATFATAGRVAVGASARAERAM